MIEITQKEAESAIRYVDSLRIQFYEGQENSRKLSQISGVPINMALPMRQHMQENEQMDEKDLECIARLLQGIIYKDDLLYSCKFCKYSEECTKNLKAKKSIHLDTVRRKLQNITGVYLEVMIPSRDIDAILSQTTNKHAAKQ